MNRMEATTLVVGIVGCLVAAGCNSQVRLGDEPGSDGGDTSRDDSSGGSVATDATFVGDASDHAASDATSVAMMGGESAIEPPDAGLYVVITGSSPLAGSYACSPSGDCNNFPYVDFPSGCGLGSLTLQVDGVTLNPGDSATSPRVHVTFDFGTIDDGMYPVGQQGSCTVTYPGTGDRPIYEVSCTGLVGTGSGAMFAAYGTLQC
jgi:hypothetical protein